MRLADENKLGREDDEEFCEKVQEDYSLVAGELTRLRAALDQLDAMKPEDYMGGQSHLSPAFREPNLKAALHDIIAIVNKVLHNTDANGNPLPEDS